MKTMIPVALAFLIPEACSVASDSMSELSENLFLRNVRRHGNPPPAGRSRPSSLLHYAVCLAGTLNLLSGNKSHLRVSISACRSLPVHPAWLDYSPPTWASWVRSSAGSLPDSRMWESYRTMPIVYGFSSGIFRFPPRFHSGAAPYRFNLFGSQDLGVRVYKISSLTMSSVLWMLMMPAKHMLVPDLVTLPLPRLVLPLQLLWNVEALHCQYQTCEPFLVKPEAGRDWLLVGRKPEEGASGKDIGHCLIFSTADHAACSESRQSSTQPLLRLKNSRPRGPLHLNTVGATTGRACFDKRGKTTQPRVTQRLASEYHLVGLALKLILRRPIACRCYLVMTFRHLRSHSPGEPRTAAHNRDTIGKKSNWAPVHNVCSVVVTLLESRRATSCGYNSSHPVWHALYECLQDIHGYSSPFLLQPFHELSNGFWPRLTSPHPAIQFVPKMFYSFEVGTLGGPIQSANIVVGVPLHSSP
ncbi:hypothetical protein PR048_007122 [Dryococelus australis]|uniref:Uncharacterized protein n=1 Tax=Dryococelus australis TaxID=614101 RepID=A0ABQ9ICQ8_9NEOP|nr:hypothetical protein PR048_007122 [Dryococelus australis]